MSDFGLSEFQRWATEYRATFTDQPAPIVTDDLVSFTTIGGFPATCQYVTLTPPQTRFRMTPEMIPGRAFVYHEMEHDRHWRACYRLLQAGAGDGERAILRELLIRRGADPAVVDVNRSLAQEQAASMLPEAFIGEWGGYVHPIYGLNPDPATIAAYATTPTAAAVRAFYLGMATWTPGGGTPFMAKWISDDLPIQLDAAGGAIIITPIPGAAGFVSGARAVAQAQRIGLAGTEAYLPTVMAAIGEDTTKPIGSDGRFYVRTVVRGDPVRPGLGYLKVSAWQ